MKIKRLTIIQSLLFLVFILDLWFIYIGRRDNRFFTKPFLVVFLALIYIFQHHRSIAKRVNFVFLLGLFFSLIGDFLLIFKDGFAWGVSSFLIAHLCYIFCFKKYSRVRPPWYFLTVISISLLLFMGFIYPYLGAMKIPIILYGAVICTTLYFALRTGNPLLLLGATLFILSDSMVATNNFLDSNVVLQLLVMITYLPAQFFFVQGMLAEQRRAIETQLKSS